MILPPTATTAYEATAQQSAELAAMRRMLEVSRGTFSLSIAVCNSPSLRDYLITRLRESFPGIAVVSVTDGASDPFGLVSSQLNGKQPDALFICDMERRIPSEAKDQPILRSLNASRELWERRIRCPVVLWLPEYAATLLSVHARDFWRYRSHRFEFVSEFATAAAGADDRLSGDLAAASNLSQDEKQFRIAELEQRLAEAGETPDPILLPSVLLWLNELGSLYCDLGRLDEAEHYWKRLQQLASRSDSEPDLANAYGNLGIVMRTRGDLEAAAAAYRKALEINEKLARVKGVANAHSNLGNVMQIRGDLDGAEAMYRKALEINEKLGRLEGIATEYGNLGNLLHARGELDGAEAMYRKSLEIDQKLGRLEGMAISYGNLGNLLHARGDLDGADAMYRKALEIDDKLGRLEGMANQYANLGIVMGMRGDLDEARQLWTKSRDLFAKLGAKHMVDRVQGWIDGLPS